VAAPAAGCRPGQVPGVAAATDAGGLKPYA